jgi:hypothetical protein
MGGSKTKKNREKRKLPEIKPIISPNVLKNKLLKRIKEHKQRETENLENNKRKIPILNENIKLGGATDEITAYSDEFSDSLNYLQTLSKQKKINDEKLNYEKQKQKRKEDLERKTIRNHNFINTVSQPIVNIDLPEELRQPLISINTENFIPSGQSQIINKSFTDSVPYGVLKGGTKPTYRDWNKTQRNAIVTNPNSALTIEGFQMNKQKSERENRLSVLREKLKQKQMEEEIKKNEDILMEQNLIKKPNDPLNVINNSEPTRQVVNNILTVNDNLTVNNNPNEEIISTKKITKKTIKRKYTLGKSKFKKTIAVLIKDRGTRKKILNAQKDLKKKSMNDVKLYLREHNLIKIGSNAPNDVLRKMYESAMLAGEITNSNAETLLHNFSKDDKEL